MKENDNANNFNEDSEEYVKLNNPNIETKIKSGSNDRYSNVSSIADLKHKRIIQSDSKEFEIKYEITRFEYLGSCISSIILLVIFILMWVLYKDDELGDSFFYYLEIAFLAVLFGLQCFGFISCPSKSIIILGENDITIKSKWNVPIFHWTEIFKSGEIKKFDYVVTKKKKKDKKKGDNKEEIVEVDDENKEVEISIQIIDGKNNRKFLCIQKFFLEEVKYFISRVNEHIEQKMKVEISDSNENISEKEKGDEDV